MAWFFSRQQNKQTIIKLINSIWKLDLDQIMYWLQRCHSLTSMFLPTCLALATALSTPTPLVNIKRLFIHNTIYMCMAHSHIIILVAEFIN